MICFVGVRNKIRNILSLYQYCVIEIAIVIRFPTNNQHLPAVFLSSRNFAQAVFATLFET